MFYIFVCVNELLLVPNHNTLKALCSRGHFKNMISVYSLKKYMLNVQLYKLNYSNHSQALGLPHDSIL